MLTNETLYDSLVLTKDSGVKRGLPFDCDQWKAEKNKLTNNYKFPQNW